MGSGPLTNGALQAPRVPTNPSGCIKISLALVGVASVITLAMAAPTVSTGGWGRVANPERATTGGHRRMKGKIYAPVRGHLVL